MIKREKSCGVLVLRRQEDELYVVLLRHSFGGHWSFPKGHVEPGETEEETACREVLEETSIHIDICPGFREVVSYSPKRDVTKDVIYFLGRARNYDYVPQASEIAQIKWVEISLAHSFLSYDNDKQLVNRARPLIRDLI